MQCGGTSWCATGVNNQQDFQNKMQGYGTCLWKSNAYKACHELTVLIILSNGFHILLYVLSHSCTHPSGNVCNHLHSWHLEETVLETHKDYSSVNPALSTLALNVYSQWMLSITCSTISYLADQLRWFKQLHVRCAATFWHFGSSRKNTSVT